MIKLLTPFWGEMAPPRSALPHSAGALDYRVNYRVNYRLERRVERRVEYRAESFCSAQLALFKLAPFKPAFELSAPIFVALISKLVYPYASSSRLRFDDGSDAQSCLI